MTKTQKSSRKRMTSRGRKPQGDQPAYLHEKPRDGVLSKQIPVNRAARRAHRAETGVALKAFLRPIHRIDDASTGKAAAPKRR